MSGHTLFALSEHSARQLRATHGGRKNCSSATYMPRNISSSKKYLPALSNEPSPSSHRFGRGNRKPGGGGPAGVAARGKVVENRATVAGDGRRPDANCDGLRSVDVGRLRASIVNGFVLAIVGRCGVAGRACWRGVAMVRSGELSWCRCNRLRVGCDWLQTHRRQLKFEKRQSSARKFEQGQ